MGAQPQVIIWRRDRCTEGHYILGLFFTCATAIVHTIATFSAPYLDYDYISTCSLLFGTRRYGTLNPPESHWNRVTHLLPSSAILSLITFLVLVVHMTHWRVLENHLWYRVLAAVTGIIGLLAAVLNTAFWVIQRDVMEARLGSGIYIAIVGGVGAVLAFFFGGPTYGGRVVYRARGSYAV